MKCISCKSNEKIKNGIVKGKQRYRCKNCGRNYTVEEKSSSPSSSIKRMSLMMYLEGLGFHSIARLLGVSHVSVLQWIKKYGKQCEEIQNKNPVSVMELDEIHSYIGQKKTIVGYGLQLIEMRKNTLISLLETGVVKQVKNYGIKLKQQKR